ncbi:hypothetical protein ABBQ32_004726 [Trebouxia sp. C0010 RCD-2024]
MGTVAEGTHSEVKQDVVLRLETLTVLETKYIMAVVSIATMIAFAALFAEFGVKLRWDSSSRILYIDHIYIINVVVACVLICQLLRSLLWMSYVVIRTWQLKRVWKRRRARSVQIFLVEIVAQLINVLAFLTVNVRSLRDDCSYLTPVTTWLSFVMWTCWNTIFMTFCVQAQNSLPQQKHPFGLFKDPLGLPDRNNRPLVVDGPIWLHTPKALLWLVTEASVIALSCYDHFVARQNVRDVVGPDCTSVLQSECKQDKWHIALTTLVIFWILMYCVWFYKYILQEFHRLSGLPYGQNRISNLLVRLNTRLRLPFMAIFVLCFILLWAVKIDSCFSFVTSWNGILPMQILETAVIVAWSFIAMPKDPKGKPALMQVWLQEFCWSHSSKRAKLAARNQSAPNNTDLTAAPMFCFEDAMKLLYWTSLVYDYSEAERTILTLDKAKELYGLESHELLWEKKHDTKCLMAFGPDAILLAFRGTASLKNATADLQAWQAVHPPLRGRYWTGQRPRVHAGFLKSWLAGKLKQKVVSSVLKALQDQKKTNSIKRVLVTGHSLGGALANLCAFDIAWGIKEAGATCDNGGKVEVSCYTFGAPRAGNFAFKSEYNALVPDSWAVINDQDVVTRGGKMIMLYSRPGQRVLVNSRGDMIVRPSWVEASLQRLPGGSVNHHLLAQYYNSMCAVILQQFENKLVCGGMEGIVQMCVDTPILGKLLEQFMGLPLEQMQHAAACLGKGQHVKISTAMQPKLAFYVRDSSQGSKRRLDTRKVGRSSDSQSTQPPA